MCLGPNSTGHTNTSPQINPPLQPHLSTGLLPLTHWSEWGHILLLFIGKYSKWGFLSPTSYTPHLPPILTPPLPPIQTAPSLGSTHIYLINLTFSLGPDEVATVWWLQKPVCDLNALITLFQQSMRLLICKRAIFHTKPWIQTLP